MPLAHARGTGLARHGRRQPCRDRQGAVRHECRLLMRAAEVRRDVMDG